MMYNNKLVVAVKSGGKVLREFKDQVYVPFGSEYTLLIKNLNSVRASVNISIDGKDISSGSSFVIDANTEVELTRFVENGNLKAGNRFKFIERTAGVESHRGVGIEDGLIRVEFQFEKPNLYTQYINYYNSWYYRPGDCLGGPYYGDFIKGSPSNKGGLVGGYTSDVFYSATSVTTSALRGAGDLLNQTNVSTGVPSNDVGVTVPGSVSNQKFETVKLGALEPEKHVIILKMLGETESGMEVVKPVTIKAKPKCVTCGKLNKATAKFCSECGTSLVIV